MRIKAATLVLAGGLLALAANAGVIRQSIDEDMVPTGRGFGVPLHQDGEAAATPHLSTRATGINYHGGPVMTGTPTVYYILYGNWSGNTAPTILSDFMTSLSGSPWFGIETTYWQTSSSGPHVSGNLTFGGSTTDSYSQGTSVSDSGIISIVSSALSSGRLPRSSNALYLVLTSSDVNENSGFCSSYCGWHDSTTISGTDIKYGFIGNPDRCPSSCEGITGNKPNGNAGADGMASIVAHETAEAFSDPDLNAWFDNRGAENADKCAWTFGTEYTTSNGSKANVHLGSRDFLIQRNWKNSGSGGCVLHL